jgi:hypothetical protein
MTQSRVAPFVATSCAAAAVAPRAMMRIHAPFVTPGAFEAGIALRAEATSNRRTPGIVLITFASNAGAKTAFVYGLTIMSDSAM